jgi:hypothetical protein
MTWAVLWGIFPAILLGATVSHLVYKWRLRPLKHFRAAQKAAEEGRLQVETVSALKSIYRCDRCAGRVQHCVCWFGRALVCRKASQGGFARRVQHCVCCS